jgi:hypothetical protein
VGWQEFQYDEICSCEETVLAGGFADVLAHRARAESISGLWYDVL